jgi:O-antigen/teichoic acid export membrane protein
LGTFQTGIRKTNQVMKQSILSLAVGLPIAYLLVSYFYSIGGPSFAVIGGIVGTLIATTPNVAWGLYWSWKKYRVKADFRVSAKIFAASAIASLVTYLFINIFSLAYWITLVTGFVVFSVVYLAGAPLLGAVNQADIDNFKTMFSSLGAISKILDVPLLFMRKMCKVNNAKKILAKNN